jgi:histidine triad (HIT) family protein
MDSAAAEVGSTARQDCIFCRIADGDIPSTEVVSTTGTYAFRDLDPQAPVHVLVVPRVHVAHAAEVAAEHGPVLAEMLATARTVAETEGIAESGYRLVFNVGDDAGNTVGHLHLHVLGGRRLGWPPG